MNYGVRDILVNRFDAGVRLGNTIDKDMIAVSSGSPMRMVVVASPTCYAGI
jgi:DNA-binding transcriptional LysR family regulator